MSNVYLYLSQIMKALMTKADNTIFAHYIFMDNEFFLPTATGVPLRITLSGTFTPGIKGGLQIARDMVIIHKCVIMTQVYITHIQLNKSR